MAETSRWIAIVDDDPSVLKALARLLGGRSWTTKTYRSGQQFIASLPGGMPACLVADLQMPEMTGLELQQALTRKGIRIPTIIITAHDQPGMRERCMAAGAVAFFAKPVQDKLLFTAIDVATRRG
jgi:FixJ family two-component response regulator